MAPSGGARGGVPAPACQIRTDSGSDHGRILGFALVYHVGRTVTGLNELLDKEKRRSIFTAVGLPSWGSRGASSG